MGPPESLVLSLREKTGAGDFIETGTYHGNTAAWAIGHFSRVTTIELSPEFHAAAQRRFQAQPRLRVLFGHSVGLLPDVLAGLTQPAIFWLDAHWSGGETAGRDAECPVLGEIGIINASRHTHAIMVDDARLFCVPPPRPHRPEHWPELAVVVNALHAGGRRYVVLHEDVLVAVAAEEKGFLADWLQAHRDEGRAQIKKWRFWK